MRNPLLNPRNRETVLHKFATVAAVASFAAIASAQDPAADGSDSMLPIIIGIAVVLLVGAVGFFVMRQQRAAARAPRPEFVDELTEIRVMKHRLVPMARGVKSGQDFPVLKLVTIGKDPTATIKVYGNDISGIHAEILPHDTGAVITDRGGYAGTVVNGEKIVSGRPHELKDKDMIQVGESQYQFRTTDGD